MKQVTFLGQRPIRRIFLNRGLDMGNDTRKPWLDKTGLQAFFIDDSLLKTWTIQAFLQMVLIKSLIRARVLLTYPRSTILRDSRLVGQWLEPAKPEAHMDVSHARYRGAWGP